MSATRNLAIVLEVGSRYTKCGFAGNRAEGGHGAGAGNYDGAPRLIMAKSMPQLLQVDLSGATPQEELTPVVPKSPEEWKVLLRPHLEHVLFQQLLCNPTDRRVVVVEDLLAPKNFRQALAECLFDLKVGSVLFAPGAQLAVLTSGTRTGIVCDLGAEEVRVLPVFDGVPMLGAYTTSQLGRGGPTEQVHERIRKTLDPEKAPGVQGSMLEDAIARCCLVPPAHQEKVGQLEAELKTLGARSSAELKEWLEGRLELARKLAEVGGDEVGECTLAGVGPLSAEARCSPAGVFFEADEEGDTLPSMIVSAVMKCPADVRRAILGNVVLAGGHAMIPGLSGRLVNALEQSMQQVPSLSGMRPALRLSRPGFNANTLSWVGGAIVGQDAEELESRSMSLKEYRNSRNTMQERSDEHIARASRDEVVQLTAEMGLEENEDADIMKASLREAMREPEAALPDWTRMVPGSTAGAAWYFEKHDESEAREWTKREEREADATRPSSWQRELDAGAGAGWMRLSDEAAAVLEAGLREHKDTVELELRQAGVPSRIEDSDEAVRVVRTSPFAHSNLHKLNTAVHSSERAHVGAGVRGEPERHGRDAEGRGADRRESPATGCRQGGG